MAERDNFVSVNNSDQLNEGFFQELFTFLGNLGTNGSILPPIGAIIAWDKTLTGVPALPGGWQECDGSAISDGDSPMDGENVPDLNSAVAGSLKGRFLRGNSTSGDTEDSANLTHSHSYTAPTGSDFYTQGGSAVTPNTTGATSGTSGGDESRPYNYSVVWIIRIK